MTVDTDANDAEVKFMYPSAKKHNKFSFGNVGPVWCIAENISLSMRYLHMIRKNYIN